MFWRSIWPALLWAVFVLILCGFPGNKLPELTFLQWLKPDKIVHLFLFGVQCYLLIRGFRKQNEFSSVYKNAIVISIVVTISFGALVEVMQSYIFVHRSGDVRDAIANAIGAFTGWWFYKKKFSLKTLFR
jgi:VanZ family protein